MATRAANGSISTLEHLVNKPVYLFSGTDDVWVYQNVMRAVEKQFQGLNANIKSEFSYPAAHSWVRWLSCAPDPNPQAEAP